MRNDCTPYSQSPEICTVGFTYVQKHDVIEVIPNKTTNVVFPENIGIYGFAVRHVKLTYVEK